MKETLLVLDLDETLLYATKDKLIQQEDFVVGQYYDGTGRLYDAYPTFKFAALNGN
ncbi:hypothetical protein [Sphingobacterium sp.]|uniref:hypothetical protein n=1 Tax=Sphingobacterium sp. TaxID=341027 RepID=UPI0031CF1C1C